MPRKKELFNHVNDVITGAFKRETSGCLLLDSDKITRASMAHWAATNPDYRTRITRSAFDDPARAAFLDELAKRRQTLDL